jgi:curved DNA-binding protein CbpA
MPLPDYYALLEVPSTATNNELRRSYRRLARKYHPDLNQQALDKHIKLLNEAYEVLSDPTKRAAYDQQRLLEEKRRKAAQDALRRQQEQARQEPKMTWIEGIFGFVRELRKELRKP